jgi:acetyl esterase/lipase
MYAQGQGEARGNRATGEQAYQMLTLNNTAGDIVNHSAFSGYGVQLLPWNNSRNNLGTPITGIASLLPYHSYIRPEVILAALNYMITEVGHGKTIFYDIYTTAQKRSEPDMNDTGLFFFRGKPGAPFVLLIPDGGWNYVGSLHEGFPIAVEIAKKGYNAFVVKYRPPREYISVDTAAALSYIFAHSQELDISTADYSLWGFSAGGQPVFDISLNGPSAYGASGVPKPCTAVFMYMWQPLFTKDDPAAFIAIGETDRIVSADRVKNNVEASRKAGADIEFHLFRDTGHGFGLGTGTNAEGWFDNAIRHWERRMKNP